MLTNLLSYPEPFQWPRPKPTFRSGELLSEEGIHGTLQFQPLELVFKSLRASALGASASGAARPLFRDRVVALQYSHLRAVQSVSTQFCELGKLSEQTRWRKVRTGGGDLDHEWYILGGDSVEQECGRSVLWWSILRL